jgi:hypothetical protein
MLSGIICVVISSYIKLDCDRTDILFLVYLRENTVSEIEPDSCRAVKPENVLKT